MNFKLPDLPYSYNSLEPHYDQQTLKLHHSKHHQSYVNGLNNALEKLKVARENNDYNGIKHWQRELAFHGSGHILHTLFFNNLGPEQGNLSKSLRDQINKDFGSFEMFAAQFTNAAKTVEASGWAVLAWNDVLEQLLVLTLEKHQNLTVIGAKPLLVIDMWEHAYYLQYQNDRAAYINAWWEIVNWNEVSRRFENP
ncbi:superoxide dismutase [Natranaerobius thermophilus]|uniref:Superoxide dismutase n=1 Tax=Natranaerobius thermophilus (strain ATCC BAA-1301 / DSM 18059 / JW/NM-WN-LF) TaxID=457570 RepID=B2A136_NATTJ|nr:superoxide dismutase [Natranaerobius thermophilus]ACB84659.1 Superoxide dismutase [Natranaerobius thermophilus JW/NM-WN-LF]